jgi:hypothetical protein
VPSPNLILPTPVAASSLPTPNAIIPSSPQPIAAVEKTPLPIPTKSEPAKLPIPATPVPDIPVKVAEPAKSTGTNSLPYDGDPPAVVPTGTPIAAVPNRLTPTNGEEVVEFKTIFKELFRTLGVRIKQTTNQIPPTIARWSKQFGHWVTDRIAAMRSSQATPDVVSSPVSSS